MKICQSDILSCQRSIGHREDAVTSFTSRFTNKAVCRVHIMLFLAVVPMEKEGLSRKIKNNEKHRRYLALKCLKPMDTSEIIISCQKYSIELFRTFLYFLFTVLQSISNQKHLNLCYRLTFSFCYISYSLCSWQ